jgi:hypothetical protein
VNCASKRGAPGMPTDQPTGSSDVVSSHNDIVVPPAVRRLHLQEDGMRR